MPERLICRAENPYGTGVCTLTLGHPPVQDAMADPKGSWFDHYDGGTKIYWVGDIRATENREPVLYSGWTSIAKGTEFIPNESLGRVLRELLTDIQQCPRCRCLVLTDDRLAHQQTEENER